MSDHCIGAKQVPIEICPTIVNRTVCVQADVTITPAVAVGEIEAFCLGAPVIGACTGTPITECTFTVHQNMCIQVPLLFSAAAVAVPTGATCGAPTVGACVL